LHPRIWRELPARSEPEHRAEKIAAAEAQNRTERGPAPGATSARSLRQTGQRESPTCFMGQRFRSRNLLPPTASLRLDVA
jgi:hypothetical protein